MSKKGILLVNLGTPDSPSVSDVRKYLLEFLLDERVIDIPWLGRQLLVRGIIGPFRAPKSAKTYKAIWTENGSPLLHYSLELQKAVQESLGDDYVVALGMRYGNPSISSALDGLNNHSLESITVLPLFPQYAGATTGSVFQKVMEEMKSYPNFPSIRFISHYYDNPEMVNVFAKHAREQGVADADHVLFSFHGLPVRQLKKADKHQHCQIKENCCDTLSDCNSLCYGAQCTATAKAIARQLNLSADKYTVCYQSRLGKTPWLQPYTSEEIEKLAKKGVKNIVVVCPAFVADCLETIFEIGEEYAEEFQHFGGEKLVLTESLNQDADWVQAVCNLVK